MNTSSAKQKLNQYDQSDAVGKLRISSPQSLIDTDFEYGLQGTKWETLELVGNYPSVGYRPSEPAFAGLVGAQGITSIVGSPNQKDLNGSKNNGTMRVTLNAAPAVALVKNNPITIKFTGTGITVASYADSTDGNGVITEVISPTVFEYKANVATLQNTITNVATENTLIYTGQWLTGAAFPVGGIVTMANSSSALLVLATQGATTSFPFPGIQFTIVSPISTNEWRSPWCGNFAYEQVGSFGGQFFSNSGLAFNTLSTFGASNTLLSNTATSPISAYMNPTGYLAHRFLDGGVQLWPNTSYNLSASIVPSAACLGRIPKQSTIIRQTRKYFRYQSGKSIQFSTGILFAPTYDVVSWDVILINGLYYLQMVLDADAGFVGEVLDINTSTVAQPYVTPTQLTITGFDDAAFNVTRPVYTCISSNTFRVLLGSSSIYFLPPSGLPVIKVVNWHDATVRSGLFDDLNGIFFEYDGTTLNVVKRSSTAQVGGRFAVTKGNSQISSGFFQGTFATNRLGKQVYIGDKLNIKGHMYEVLSNPGAGAFLNIAPPYRGSTSTNTRVTKVTENRVSQANFNLDKLDGTGPSGYVLDINKMQMVHIDYSWYGAGRIRFGMLNNEGNVIWCHEMMNNNTNTEAYMKSGNLPARFEIATKSKQLTITGPDNVAAGTGMFLMSTYATDAACLPLSGKLFFGYEVMHYVKQQVDVTTNMAALSVTQRSQPGGITAGAFPLYILTGDKFFSINQNCAPALSHWGTSVIMDGGFDQDKSYLFTAASLSATVVPPQQEYPIISIRLGPSVDNGIIGAYGVRAQNNRAQLTLNSLGAAVAGQGQIILRLNPQSQVYTTRNTSWTNVGGGSLAQYMDHSVVEATTRFANAGGETIGAFFCNQTTGTSFEVTPIDIQSTRELGNSILGGDFVHPDGPDILCVYIKNITTANLNLSAFARITWTESQG